MGCIQIGNIYRHFKGGLYQVICTAEHSETREELVIYQALYGDFKVYARPQGQFFEVLDKEKYPDTRQLHRFEIVKEAVQDGSGIGTEKSEGLKTCTGTNEEAKTNIAVHEKESEKEDQAELSVIMQFLEASGSKDKLEIIKNNYAKIDERTINNIEASMDIVSNTNDLDARISYVCDVLRTKAQYENTRLRN